MCWADKVTAIWAGIVFAALLFISRDFGAFMHWMDIQGIRIVLTLIAPIWLLLRGFDWVAGGPGRRRGY